MQSLSKKKNWPSIRTIQRFNTLSSGAKVKFVHRKVNALKPESTGEAKSYFKHMWDSLLMNGACIPTIYYGNTRG